MFIKFLFNLPDLNVYFFTSLFVFITSLLGLFVMRHNLIVLLMAIELMFFSVTLNFVFFSVYLDDFQGQIFAIFILTVAAAESSVGLAILIIYYRLRGVIASDLINLLKG